MPVSSQPDLHWNVVNRRGRVFTDQHGRKWWTQIDMKANSPCSPWEPHDATWHAPWYLPQEPKYYTVFEDDDQRGLILQYDLRADDLKTAHKAWFEQMMAIGMKMSGQSFNARHPSPEVLHFAGPKPAPLEPVFAAKAGDPWVLGFSPVMPTWAEPFFIPRIADEFAFLQEAAAAVRDTTPAEPDARGVYGRFINAEMKKGTSYADARRLWHVQKGTQAVAGT